MSVVGETLYNERIKQGLTISNISKKTNIREYYIIAIEKGQFDRLPGDVYAKGFISNYAKVVGLDEKILILEYKKEINKDSKDEIDSDIKKDNPLSQKESISLSNQKRNINKSLFLKLTIIILILIVLIASFFLVLNKSDNTNHNKQQDIKSSSKSNIIMKSNSELDKPLINKNLNLVSIKILANDKCWTEVEIDDKSEFYGMLNKGQTKNWNGRKATIKVGNINAVDIYVNNKKYIPTKQELINAVVKKEFNVADK